MDLICPVCGEPWDLDTLHEMGDWVNEKLTFSQALKRFANKGCEAFGCKHNETPDKDAAETSSMLFDILGDDVDGIASCIGDFLR